MTDVGFFESIFGALGGGVVVALMKWFGAKTLEDIDSKIDIIQDTTNANNAAIHSVERDLHKFKEKVPQTYATKESLFRLDEKMSKNLDRVHDKLDVILLEVKK